MTSVNGHAPSAAPAMAPLAVPPVRQAGPALDDPGQSRTAAAKPGRWRGDVDGDTVIRLLAAAVVLAVAAFAAIVSYSHIFELGRHHGQDGAAARLLPLSVDGLIAAASLVMLHAARKQLAVPFLSRAMLALGVGATVAANVAYGMPFGWLAAVISAWPAAAFVGSVEMAVRFVVDARTAAAGSGPAAAGSTTRGDSDQPGGDRHDDALSPPSPAWQAMPPGRDKAAAILRDDPAMTNAEVAVLAGCDPRTVTRARKDIDRSPERKTS